MSMRALLSLRGVSRSGFRPRAIAQRDGIAVACARHSYALDTYVAAGRALSSDTAALALAASAIVVLLGFWYAYPLWRRMQA
jgi:hypothetical protein